VIRRPARSLHRDHLASLLKRRGGGFVAEVHAPEKFAELIGLADGLLIGHGVSPWSLRQCVARAPSINPLIRDTAKRSEIARAVAAKRWSRT
jgi:hypothetical protein